MTRIMLEQSGTVGREMRGSGFRMTRYTSGEEI
jgi:hypothetical protein